MQLRPDSSPPPACRQPGFRWDEAFGTNSGDADRRRRFPSLDSPPSWFPVVFPLLCPSSGSVRLVLKPFLTHNPARRSRVYAYKRRQPVRRADGRLLAPCLDWNTTARSQLSRFGISNFCTCKATPSLQLSKSFYLTENPSFTASIGAESLFGMISRGSFLTKHRSLTLNIFAHK